MNPDEDGRRQYQRVSPNGENPFTAGLSGGAHVKLLDLSRGGARFECDRRLNPNSTVSLRLVTRNETASVSARVVRSRLIKLESGALGYLVAVAFNEPLKDDFSPDTLKPAPDAAPAAPPPAHAAPPPGAAPHVGPEIAAPAFGSISEADVRAFESALTSGTGAATMTATVETPPDSLRDIPGRDRP